MHTFAKFKAKIYFFTVSKNCIIGTYTCNCPGQTVDDGSNNCNCPGQTVDQGSGNCACPGNTEKDEANNCNCPGQTVDQGADNCKISKSLLATVLNIWLFSDNITYIIISLIPSLS